MARSDADALLLQVSADIRGLEKQFAKAVAVVDDGSKKMEGRAKKAMQNIEASNDNLGKKLARGFGTNLGENIRDLAGQSGQLTTVLGEVGPAGVAAAAGVGALLAVLGQAKAAIAFGDAIADSAAKIGVSTNTLQEYRYAIHQVGGDYDDADEALSKFTQSLGKAQLGFSQKALKPFAALGFSQEDLNGFKSADDALRAILDRLSQVQSESKRQGLASAMGLEKFIPLARLGSAGIDDLTAAAHRLGYVMGASLIAKAGEANDKLEDLQQIASVQLKSAFVDLAPVVLSVAGAIADMAREINDLSKDVKDALPVLDRWMRIANGGDVSRAIGNISPAVSTGLGVAGFLKSGVRGALDKAAAAGRYDNLRSGISDLLAGKAIARPADFNDVYGPKAKPAFDPELPGGAARKSLTGKQKAAADGRFASGAPGSIVVNTDTVEFTQTPDVFTPRGGLSDLAKNGGADFKSSAERMQGVDADLKDLWQRQYDGIYDATYGALDAAFRGGAKGVLSFFIHQLEQQLITSLAKSLASAGSGSSSGWVKAAGSLFGLPGFDVGGFTGSGAPGSVAGVVHGREYVFDEQSTAKLGVANLDALRRGLRGFRAGGYVGYASSAMPSLSGLSRPVSGSPYFDLRGALMTEDLLAQMNQSIAASEARSTVRGSRNGALLARVQAQQAAATKLGF